MSAPPGAGLSYLRGLQGASRSNLAAEWRWGIPLVLLATALRLGWALAVPTVPVGDFATYRESANYLVEFGSLDRGFIYMPGFVLLLAGVRLLGGELVAQKLLGALFGGLAAAAIFGMTARLDGAETPAPSGDGDGGAGSARPRICPCPTAVIATLAYALWPAGIAMSSVVGTDVPAAALMVCALWALAGWGERRPWLAALAFGAVMGLAAYIRAVALPLTLMSAGYWLAQRGLRRWRQVVLLTALAGATTLLVLLPWGLRNRRAHGELYFTDSHGGITALIGANPNSEGTYTRALNDMFRQLTGRSVLDEPHRQTDRAAYALAKEWTRFELPYAAGLVALKADRLLSPERDLLYWPIGRPGVLVGGPQQRWFAAHAGALHALADGFWLALVSLFVGGLGLALYQRRWTVLTWLPFQLALAATYTVFFAEPRYRIPIEMMAFPVAAFTLRQLWTTAARLLRQRRSPEGARAVARAARPLAVVAASLLIVFLAWPALLEIGGRLRLQHRWAATVWTMDGQPRLAKWRRQGPVDGPSPVVGAPNGVRLTLPRLEPAVTEAHAEARIETAPLPAGLYQLRGQAVPSGIPAGAGLRFILSGPDGAIAEARFGPPGGAGATTAIAGVLRHPGGPLHLSARLERAGSGGPAGDPGSLWLTAFDVQRTAN
jgi:4-amino-4-deoxy-L-arabinose transferase-like glycosyltransferase